MKKNIDIAIIVPPAGFKNCVYPPYGAMYVSSALRQEGYGPYILNVDTERISNEEIIQRIKSINPRYIAFSGIVATLYKYIKTLSSELKMAFPEKIQILGGGLSAAADVILKNTAIDIVVLGEGENSAVELLKCLGRNESLHSVKGISFKEAGRIYANEKRPLIRPLDSLPYAAYDLIDMHRYLPDGQEFIRFFMPDSKDKRIFDKNRKRKMMTIATTRGCFGECSFCFRAYPGIRTHSMKYVFDLIEYCIDKFDVGYFNLGDECFAPTKKRNWEFIEEFKKRKLDIIFRILGMRVDTVDKEILKAYKEIGCWMIEYGFESGSQKMLNIINKGVTVDQNRKVARWTLDAGIYTSPAIIIGFPGETNETINETMSFLKDLNFSFKQYQWKYPIPIPGSALYEFARLSGAIKDEDEYLMSLEKGAQEGSVFNVNLTELPDHVVAGWDDLLKRSMDNHYLSRYKNPFFRKVMQLVEVLKLHYRRKDLLKLFIEKARATLNRSGREENAGFAGRKHTRFRKSKNINLEDLLKSIDCTVINREASLKSINKKILERKIRNNEAVKQ